MGIWATFKTLIPDNPLDVYLLSMTDSGYTAGGALPMATGGAGAPNLGQFPYALKGNVAGGSTRVYNLGARIKGNGFTNLDYTVELNQQFGTAQDNNNINAFGGAAVVGYTVPDAMGFRVSGEYVYASGDSSPTTAGTEHKTFYQFTPSPHMHLGAQDLIAFQNIKAARLGASFKPKDNLKLSADFWNFKLAQANDFWYESNGTTTRGGTGLLAPGFANLNTIGATGILANDNVGNEIDLIANYSYTKALSFEAGYSVFNPGSGITNALTANLAGHTTGQGDAARFAWGMLTLKF